MVKKIFQNYASRLQSNILSVSKTNARSCFPSNGNRTEWSPIQSVIIRVITKSDDRAAGSDLFITSMITD